MKRLSTLCTVFTIDCVSTIMSNKKLKRTFQVPLRCDHLARPPSYWTCGCFSWVSVGLGGGTTVPPGGESVPRGTHTG